MASSSNASKRVAYNIALHLQSEVAGGKLNEDEMEGLDVAMQCICQAYNLDLEDEEQKKMYAIPSTLEDLVERVCATESGSNGEASSGGLRISDEDKTTAEDYKQQGNVHQKASRYEEALDCYTKALTMDPTNPTFYCNRAATYIKLDKLELAAIDCKKSISLKPDYARAHGRLGFIYSRQDKLQLSKECFKKALSLDPDNSSYRENLQVVEDRISGPTPRATPQAQAPGGGTTAGGGGAGGGAGPSGPAGPGGPMGFLGNLLQNPGFMNMATSLMQTPAFQDMASQMMSRSAGTPSEVTPDVLSQVSNVTRELQQNNPELLESMQRVVSGVAQQQQQQQGQQQQQQQGQEGQQPQENLQQSTTEQSVGENKANESSSETPAEPKVD